MHAYTHPHTLEHAHSRSDMDTRPQRRYDWKQTFHPPANPPDLTAHSLVPFKKHLYFIAVTPFQTWHRPFLTLDPSPGPVTRGKIYKTLRQKKKVERIGGLERRREEMRRAFSSDREGEKVREEERKGKRQVLKGARIALIDQSWCQPPRLRAVSTGTFISVTSCYPRGRR